MASGHPGGWNAERGAVIRAGRILRIQKTRQRDGTNSPHTITTDCALIGGDSGGPLFNLKGELIGVHSRIGTDVDENMHVPVDVFAVSWERMTKKEVWGSLPGFQPYIGVKPTPGEKRAIVGSVARTGPAFRAGVKAGDLVVNFDGRKITTFEELEMAIEAKSPGDTIILKVRRENSFYQLPIVIGVSES